MAKCKPELCTGISGIVESSEFASTTGGIVLKRKKPNRKMNSAREIHARTEFQRRAAAWKALDEYQVLAWNKYAEMHPVKNRLGRTILLTGYNLYMRFRHTWIDGDIPVDPPAPPVIVVPPIIYGYPFTLPITWPAGTSADCYIDLWYTTLVGRDYPKPGDVWVYIGRFDKLSFSGITSVQLAELGFVPTANTKYAFKFYMQCPNHWPGFHSFFEFTCPIQYILWLPCDDNENNHIIHDAWGLDSQVASFITNTRSVPGKVGLALWFNGSPNYVRLTAKSHQPYIEANKDFTITFWVKGYHYGTSTPYNVCGNYSATKSCFQFYAFYHYFAIRMNFFVPGDSYTTAYTWTPADPAEWARYTLVRSGTIVKFYKGSSMDHEASNHLVSGSLADPARLVTIGGAAQFQMDDFRLYGCALTDQQIGALP